MWGAISDGERYQIEIADGGAAECKGIDCYKLVCVCNDTDKHASSMGKSTKKNKKGKGRSESKHKQTSKQANKQASVTHWHTKRARLVHRAAAAAARRSRVVVAASSAHRSEAGMNCGGWVVDELVSVSEMGTRKREQRTVSVRKHRLKTRENVRCCESARNGTFQVRLQRRRSRAGLFNQHQNTIALIQLYWQWHVEWAKNSTDRRVVWRPLLLSPPLQISSPPHRRRRQTYAARGANAGKIKSENSRHRIRKHVDATSQILEFVRFVQSRAEHLGGSDQFEEEKKNRQKQQQKCSRYLHGCDCAVARRLDLGAECDGLRDDHALLGAVRAGGGAGAGRGRGRRRRLGLGSGVCAPAQKSDEAIRERDQKQNKLAQKQEHG
jgi:hypothetical protein